MGEAPVCRDVSDVRGDGVGVEELDTDAVEPHLQPLTCSGVRTRLCCRSVAGPSHPNALVCVSDPGLPLLLVLDLHIS